MKRRSETNPKDPLHMASSSLYGSHKDRSYENRSRPSNSLGTKDISRGKRVKFTDPGTDCPPDSSTIPYERTEAARSDGPKTSEYAFFKKLKKDASQTSHSHPPHKEGTRLGNSESRNSSGEMSKMVRHSLNNLNSSLLVENARPTNLDAYPSSLGDPSNTSEMSNMFKHNSKTLKSPLLAGKVASINSDPGTQSWNEGVFSTKRQRLHQWALSSLGADELCAKGCDMVSVLLSRLFPKINEKSSKDPILRQVEIDTHSELPPFPESDSDFVKLRRTTTNSKESGRLSYMDDDYSSSQPNSSRKVNLSKWDIVDCVSPPSHARKTHLQCKVRDFDCGRTERLCTESDSSFGFSFEKYQSLESNHSEELHKFHGSTEPADGRQPHSLMLGWNFDNANDEQGLAVSSCNTKLSLYPTLPTSWCDDELKSLDNKFDANGLSLSSFLINCPPKFTSYSHIPSARCCPLDLEIDAHGEKVHLESVVEDNEDLDAALYHFPRFRQAEIDTQPAVLDFPKSDADFMKLQWTTTDDVMEPKNIPCMDHGPLAHWSNNAGKLIFSKQGTVNCDSPPSPANKTKLQYNIRGCDHGKIARLCTESDSDFGFSYEKYRYLSPNHFKEPHEFHDPNESALGKQSHSLLPGWIFDKMKDEQDLSISSYNTDWSVYSALPSSRCGDQWKSLDNRFDANELCLSSFLSRYPPNFTSLPHLHSASYSNLDFDKGIGECKEDLDAALNHFPKFRQAEIDTQPPLIDFPESDADFTTQDQSCMPYMGDGFSGSSNSNGKVLVSKWDSVGCDSPTRDYNKIHLHYKIREFDYGLDGEKTPRLWSESDSAFVFSFENYHSLASTRVKELHEFHHPIKSAIGRRPNSRMLGWKFDNNPGLHPALPTSWCDNQRKSLDTDGLCLPASYHNLEFGRNVVDDKESFDAALSPLPLKLLYTPDLNNFHDGFQMPHNNGKTLPLLLDKSSWDGSNGETHLEDSDVNTF